MNCKFCGAELEDGVTLCPVCGKENADEVPTVEAQPAPEPSETGEEAAPEVVEGIAPELAQDVPSETGEDIPAETGDDAPQTEDAAPAKKRKGLGWKIALAAVGGLVLLGVLVFALLKGLGVEIRIPKNDLYRKSSYTAAEEQLDKTGPQVVAKLNGRELTNTQLQFYYWAQVNDFLNYVGSYAIQMGLDYTSPLDQQKCAMDETMTWQQYFLQYALQMWQRYQVLVSLSEEAGMEPEMLETMDALPANLEQTAAQYGFDSVDAMVQAQFGPGVTVADYVEYMKTYYIALQYFNMLYESIDPSLTDLDTYYREHTEDFQQSGITQDSGNWVDVRHVLLIPKGGTTDEDGNVTYSDEEWEECRQRAQDLLDEWLAGEATEESFAEMANAQSEDPGSNTNGGLYTQWKPTDSLLQEYKDWIFDESRQPGDYGLIRTSSGYHIMYFVKGEEGWVITARTNYISDKVSEQIDEAAARWPMKVTYKKIAIGELSFNTGSSQDDSTATTGATEAPETSTGGTEPAQTSAPPEESAGSTEADE